MNRRRRYLSHLAKGISISSIVILIGLLLYTRNIAPPFSDEILSSYQNYRLSISIPSSLCLIAIPLGIFVTIFHEFVWQRKVFSFILTVLSVLLSCMLMGSLASIFFSQALRNYRHHDTLITNQYNYHLSSEWVVGVGGASSAVYLLWECDSSDTICSIVESERIPPIFLDQDYQNSTATLEIDNETQHIKMTIIARGEVISTEYHPPDD